MPAPDEIDRLFEQLGLVPDEACHSSTTRPDQDGETLHSVETTWAALHRTDVPHLGVIAAAGIESGWLMFDLEERLDIVLALADDVAERIDIGAVLAWLAERTGSPYGFAFHARNPHNAVGYGHLSGGTPLLAEDDLFAFGHDRAWFGGPERYRHEAMRLVYPVNVLMPSHLEAPMAGQTLREWIAETSARGAVEQTGARIIWTVPAPSIPEVNRSLGEAGLLLAWAPKPTRRQRPA